MTHRLDPLLNPASIAVLGASERAGSVGLRTIKNLLLGNFAGQQFAVNPGYQEVRGIACYPDMASLPQIVEHVIFTVSDERLEAALDEVISHGAKAITIMSSLIVEGDPGFRERITKKIEQAGIIVCGANSMGFFNFRSGVWACGFDTRENHVHGGNVTLISQSGSGMSGIVDCESRIDFNLAISTGQERTVALDEYIDYALEQPETRVIGLFVEAVRNPDSMIAALAKAAEKRIPIVAIKVGKTEFSARMAITHSGAIAGRDAAYQAIFERYGVQRVNDMDELATALILFAQPHPVGPGGLVAIHDSGGEQQLLIDMAERIGVPLAEISDATKDRLTERLDPGLPPTNPLDAWGAGGADSDRIMEDCFAALMTDDNAALGAVVHDRAPNGAIYPHYLEYINVAHQASGKPAILVANRQGTGSDELVVSSTRNGFPVLDGLAPFLKAVSCVFAYRDFCERQAELISIAEPAKTQTWFDRLDRGDTLDEAESSALLRDFGIPVAGGVIINSEEELLSSFGRSGVTLVLKTAEPGINHKTDVGGVVLNIESGEQLLEQYRRMSPRLGSRVLVSPMIDEPGAEMVLGMLRDEQFGPLVVLGFGGIDVEALKDVVCALPPFGPEAARRMVDSLKLRAILNEGRTHAEAAINAYCRAASDFSVMVDELGDVLEEIDVNPIIVHEHGCIAVDALVVGRNHSNEVDESRRAL